MIDKVWIDDTEVRQPSIGPKTAEPSPFHQKQMTPTQALTTRFDGDIQAQFAHPNLGKSIRNEEKQRQGLRVGDLRFMIRYSDGSQLAEVPVLHKLPNAPDWFCGVANIHGKLIPVFDLASFLSTQPPPDTKRMLLVLLSEGEPAGVLIEGLPERLRWIDEMSSDLSTAPQNLVPYLRGSCLIGDELWFELDTHFLLDRIEQSLAGQA